MRPRSLPLSVAGLVVDYMGGFYWVFAIAIAIAAAAVTLLGCLAFGMLISRLGPIKWSTQWSDPAIRSSLRVLHWQDVFRMAAALVRRIRSLVVDRSVGDYRDA